MRKTQYFRGITTVTFFGFYTEKGFMYALSYFQVAYNPTPEKDWCSLLTLSSDENLKWFWHDGGKLMIFIETKMLKKSNFDLLKSDAG